MGLVALGHMFPIDGVLVGRRASPVRGNAFTEMEDFYRRASEARLHLLTGKLVRNAVVMTVDFDVVIDIGADGFPTGDQVSLGGQRLESGSVQFDEQGGASALPFAEGTMVQFFEQLTDGLVQFRQGEEPVVPQGR